MAKSRDSFAFFLLVLIIQKCQGRYLGSNSSSELVSDGLHDINSGSPSLLFKGLDSSEVCEHMFGFLPCTDNLVGHFFQIVMYEYLLFHGESYISGGSERVFKILGPGLFGASAFHVLGALPQSMIVLVSGLSKSKEIAQVKVMTGFGMLAGSTVLLLTLLWGTCVIFGRRDFSQDHVILEDSKSSILKEPKFERRLSWLSGTGVNIDEETSYTSMIMTVSVVPFIIVQMPRIFKFSSMARSILMLASLIVSVLFLFSYFFYQVFKPWIQKRRLEYVKNDHLMVDFLKHIQRHASGKLLTRQGAPNFLAIRRLFRSIDLDEDKTITLPELKQVVIETKAEEIQLIKNAIVAIMNEFDLDHDQKITEEEFENVCIKWLLKNNHAINKEESCSRDELYQQIMREYVWSKHLLCEISKHVESNIALGSLLTDDGRPSIPNIKRLFESFDHDNDNYISHSELEQLIRGMKIEKIGFNREEVVAELMKVLDKDGNQKIDEKEFVDGVANLLGLTTVDDIFLETWKETDKVLDDEKETKGQKYDGHLSEWFNSILLLLVGFILLSLLAEPLVESVQNFSEAAGIPPFFVSFVLVPLATNSREAVSAIVSASHRKPRTTSLAFSEIYGGVFTNNVLGLSLLLSIVYGRGLTWDFSAEVLIIIIICLIIGLIGSLRTKFPVWTCFIAYLLYPFSLMFVYVLDYVFGWS
ncbi:hypothetical protein IFM89_032562 [Coptis chinensis]|uniref:EF-hand domain-containing protein n=1 Tax=Coptis chinensis TaxID=261450 RepID=A0A835M5J8_9MAGN|nr:hypothetical protein IFM89_032562 [Coptis chinensis]